jgi:hypothetical protein
MKAVKRIDGDYEITSINASDTITIATSLLTVSGNLIVTGTRNEIRSVVTTITDPFMSLADGNDGTQHGGIEVIKNASTGTKAGIRYNISTGYWQASSDFSTWANIVSGAIPASGSGTHIQYNNNGYLGAEANFAYNSTTNTFTLDGLQVLANQAATPTVVANSVVLYSKTVSSGGTGLFFVNSTASDELVSKSKAIVYGIIF